MREVYASTRGLIVTAAMAILLVFLFDLSAVASLGAAASLMVYFLVNIGALKLIDASGMRLLVIHASIVSCGAAILIWVIHSFRTNPSALGVFATFLVGSLLAEALLQRTLKRRVQTN